MKTTTDNEEVDLVKIPLILSALDNPHRLRVIAALKDGRQYVSELARHLGLSRPLLYLHLEKLQAAGLVQGSLELGPEGKAIKWYELVPFDVRLTPEVITSVVNATAAIPESSAPTSNVPASNEPREAAKSS